jgi:hypothetical protein
MTSLRVRMLAVAAVALTAVCASAVSASAQAVKGSFTLPNEVRWQGNTLPAGDYTFEMKSTAVPSTITLNGPDGCAFIMALVANGDDSKGKSALIIERRGYHSFVRELYLAQIGVRLRYHVPKAPKDVELAQVTTETILVAMK